MTMGARLALERRPGVGGRAATAALTFGVTAVAAALTFGAGLNRGSQDGGLSGQSFDTYTVRVGAADVPPDALAAWQDDERVVTATRIVNTVTPINGRTVGCSRSPISRAASTTIRSRPHPDGAGRDLVRPDRDGPPRARHR